MSTVRARVYARVSTEDQVSDNSPTFKQSLADQVEAGKAECAKRGWQFDGAYVEPGITGETLEGRPQMMHALADAKARGYDVLIAYHGDRIARDMGVYMTIVQRIELAQRIPIQTLNAPRDFDPLRYDPNADDSAILHHGMQAFFGTLDQRSRGRRLRQGYIAQIKRGRYIASYVPYGYVVQETIENGFLVRTPVPDPARYPYLALIRDMAFGGMSTRQIAYALETEHHAPTTKGGLWLKSSVAHILSQPFYGGKIAYMRTTTKGNDGHPRKNTDPDQIIYADHAYAHPWTWDEYERLQANQRARAARPARALASRNPLAGILVCHYCQHTMMYKWDARPEKAKWAYFVCGQWNANHAACVPNRIPARDVFETVWRALRSLAERASRDPAAFDAAFAVDTVSTERATLTARATHLTEAIAALETRESLLDKNVALGLIPPEKYATLLTIIQTEQDSATHDLSLVQSALRALDARMGHGAAVRSAATAFAAIDVEMLATLPETWPQPAVRAVKAVVATVWKSIAVHVEVTDTRKVVHLDYVENAV